MSWFIHPIPKDECLIYFCLSIRNNKNSNHWELYLITKIIEIINCSHHLHNNLFNDCITVLAGYIMISLSLPYHWISFLVLLYCKFAVIIIFSPKPCLHFRLFLWGWFSVGSYWVTCLTSPLSHRLTSSQLWPFLRQKMPAGRQQPCWTICVCMAPVCSPAWPLWYLWASSMSTSLLLFSWVVSSSPSWPSMRGSSSPPLTHPTSRKCCCSEPKASSSSSLAQFQVLHTSACQSLSPSFRIRVVVDSEQTPLGGKNLSWFGSNLFRVGKYFWEWPRFPCEDQLLAGGVDWGRAKWNDF